GVSVTAGSQANLSGGTISITSGFDPSHDALALPANGFGIGGSYNPATGVLTLSGTSSVANYQAALRSITFANTNLDPEAVSLSRTISIVLTDGVEPSTPATRGVTISPVNTPPLNSVPGGQSTQANTTLTLSGASAIQVSDVDADGATNEQ